MKQFIILIFFLLLTGCVKAPATLNSFEVTDIIDAPKEPIPRIEHGGYNGGSISLDKSGRWLVSASETIQVWDMHNGKLENTIRPPLGKGGNRAGFASISPDGELVAVGGFTQFTNATDNSLAIAKDGYYMYVFNRADGRMVASLGNQPGWIANISFSPNGKYLAFTTSYKGNRLRIFKVVRTNDTTTLKLAGEVMGVTGDFDFSPDSKKLVLIHFHNLKLYDLSELNAAAADETILLRPIADRQISGGSSVDISSESNTPVNGILKTVQKAGRPKRENTTTSSVTQSINLPRIVKFSPDNTQIAVSYLLTGTISIVSASDLKPIATHDNPDTAKGSGSRSIAWSSTGESLFMCLKKTDHYLIRQWNRKGRGKPSDHEAASSRYMEARIIYHPDNYLIVSTVGEQSALTSYTLSGKKRWSTGTGMSHLTSSISSLMLSNDGASVAFKTGGGTRDETIGFSTQNRSIIINPDVSQLHRPTEFPQFNKIIDDYGKLFAKSTGGDMRKNSTAAAMAADNTSVLLVDLTLNLKKCSSTVRTFSDLLTTQCVWQKKMPGLIKALNVSRDGRFAVAALADGTIKWYRYSDGEEVATLFIHPDRKRWVLWTAEGYFDASPGGAELMGYHINQGKDKEARFVTISNLYDVFYRPDIVQAKMRGEDISSLITMTAAEALKTPPPEIRFTKIPAKSAAAKAKVCYQVKSTGGGIGEVRLFQNGKLIKSDGFYREAARHDSSAKVQLASLNSRAIYQEQRGLAVKEKKTASTATTQPKGDLFDDCVEIEPIAGENEISVAAFNAPNTVQGHIETATFASTRKADKPHLYILSVGIDTYNDSSINLKYAAKDAKDFIARLSEKARSIYNAKNIHQITLTDQHAGKQDILRAINDLSTRIKHNDGFIFFNASHGVLLQNQYYIVTSDFDGDIEKTSNLISSNEIVEMSKKIRSLSQLFIFDTCHAGGVDNIVSGLYDARMVNLARKMGLHIYASAGSVQTAMDGYHGNGLYTYTLLQGIKNGREVDKGHSGKVTVKNLGQYTKEKTTEISTKLGHPQTPFIIDFGKDNPLFVVR